MDQRGCEQQGKHNEGVWGRTAEWGNKQTCPRRKCIGVRSLDIGARHTGSVRLAYTITQHTPHNMQRGIENKNGAGTLPPCKPLAILKHAENAQQPPWCANQ